jgi:predicted DNA-binding transcriptional regulator YafY
MGGYKPAEKIVLEVTGALARSLPFQLIHFSQKTIESSEDRIVIELTLINNEELFRKIITMTGSVKVIEPEELRLRVIEELKKAIYTYYQ